MATDLIRYDLLVQDALRGVVRKVLSDAARDGLPGDHHFSITFLTHAPGVRLSSRMREQYPEEMTIILQHQFWDLSVTEHAFEVGLSFRNVPEMLLIPFDALTGFYDASVPFGMKFELQDETLEAGANDMGTLPSDGAGGESLKPQPQRLERQASDLAASPDLREHPQARVELETANADKVISIDAFRKKT
jgi:hypothetical protein